MIKIFEKKKFLSLIPNLMLSLAVLIMASSFVFRMVISPPVDPGVEDDAVEISAEKVIQVNVLNACGEPGIAAKTKEFLRSRGFDVVEIGNYNKKLDQSIVYDRVGDIRSSIKVAYAVGIADSMVTSKIDSNLFLRSTVILGKDFSHLKPFH